MAEKKFNSSDGAIEITVPRGTVQNPNSPSQTAPSRGILTRRRERDYPKRRLGKKGIRFFDLGFRKIIDDWTDWAIDFPRTLSINQSSNGVVVSLENLLDNYNQLIALIMETPPEDWERIFYQIPQTTGYYGYGFLAIDNGNSDAVSIGDDVPAWKSGKLRINEFFTAPEDLYFVGSPVFCKNGFLRLRGANKNKITRNFDFNAPGVNDFRLDESATVFVLPSVCETLCQINWVNAGTNSTYGNQYLAGNARILPRADFALPEGAWFRTGTVKYYNRDGGSEPISIFLDFVNYLKSKITNLQVKKAIWTVFLNYFWTTQTAADFPESPSGAEVFSASATLTSGGAPGHSLSLVIKQKGEFFYVWD